MERGIFGDTKDLGDGVTESRVKFGGGLRVYYADLGSGKTSLLRGGNKSSQLGDEDIP